MSPELRSELSASWDGAIRWDVDMGEYCTLRTGGRAEALLTVEDGEELADLMRWLRRNNINWRVIGRGSNILVRSSGFKGILILLAGEFREVDYAGDRTAGQDTVMVRAGGACSIARLIAWCSSHAMSGLEFMVGIPGSVGGAVRMNAGAWGSAIGDRIVSVSFMDREGGMHEMTREELVFAYRHFDFGTGAGEDAVITGAVLRVEPGVESEITERCRKYLEMRRAKQPTGVGSAGSFFKNPPGDSAGRLIDDAGLKGLRRGDAMVSTKHANFIINTGRATPDDMVELMKEVQRRVHLHSGVMLEPEVQVL